MKKKNGKKGFTRRLLALMLCCLFVLVSIPAAAMSIEAESSQAVSEENVSAQSEEGAEKSAAVPETASETGDSQEISESKPESAEETGNENAAEAGNGENTGAAEAQPEEKKDEAEQPEATPTETPEATQTPEATPTEIPEATQTPAEEKSAKDVLYDRLMACTTYEEMETILNALTEEEEALIEQFSDEQNAALEAKVAELGGYNSETLENRTYTIKQGGTATVTIDNMVNEGFSYSCTASGITAKIASTSNGWSTSYIGYTISVGSSVPEGTYVLTVNYRTSGWFGNTSAKTDTITVKVEKASKSATINSIVTHAVVTYYYYTNGQWVNGGVYTHGQTFSIAYNKGDDPSRYVFFAKPEENYLLSTFSIVNETSGDTFFDLYSTTNWDKSNIKDYPGLQSLVATAEANGYLCMNGYITSAAGNVTLNQYFTGTQPGLNVSATANPNSNVKPGDKVEFTVTITPQKANAGDRITELNVTSLTINGRTYEKVAVTNNGDGTYTATVDYEATTNDWQTGNINLEVTANVKYKYVLPVKDRDDVGSDITTESTITSTGTTTVTLANPESVAYQLRYEAPDGITPPDTIPDAPTDSETYFEGKEVTVKDYNRADIDDSENGGTWKFTGWKVNEEGEDKNNGDKVVMGTEKILFVGVWTFEKYPTAQVTITKTVSGNMSNHNDSFEFTVEGSSEANANTSFKLKHGESQTITVRVGDTIIVTEKNGNYTPSYTVTATNDDGSSNVKDSKDNSSSVSYTVADKSNVTIAFTNKYEVTIPTGVSLDSLPYIIVLAVVALGGIVLLKTRRIRRDD